MSDSNEKLDLLHAIETASKFVGLTIGIIYLVGFLVVAAHLSRYGVSSFSVLQLQYLIAGVWTLGLPTMYFSITYTAREFENKSAPVTQGKFSWRRFLVSAALTAIPLGLFLALLAAIPHFLTNITAGILFPMWAFFIGTIFSAQMLWNAWRVPPDRETWLANRRHAAPFYLTLLVSVVLAYVVWFAIRIYPLIPSSLGGGKPLTVAFIESDKRFPDGINVDIAHKRSVPYRLIMATDKYYVVLSAEPGEKSIEVSRDSVAGMVVLEDPQ